jgi:putative MATE family efflux protein
MSRSRLDEYRERVLKGSVIASLLRLGAPPMVARLAGVAYSVLNSLWLTLYSEAAIAIPRQVFPVTVAFNTLLNMLTTAGTSLVSQYMGARMYGNVKIEASRLLTATLAFSLPPAAAFYALRPLIFGELIASPPEIIDEVMRYTAVTAANLVLAGVSSTLTVVVSSVGETRLTSVINVAAVVVNAALDPVFILGLGPVPRMGAMGSALTDTLGHALSIACLYVLIRKRLPEITPVPTLNFTARWFAVVARIGGPVALTMLVNSLAFMTQVRMVNEFGVNVAAAYSIGFLILDIVDAAMWGLSGSIAVIVGQCLGAGEPRRAKEAAIKGSLFIASLVALGALAIYPVREGVVRVFTSNPEVAKHSLGFLDTILLGLPFFALFIAGNSAARGAGRTLVPTAIGLARLWLVRIGLSYVLAFALGWGPAGIWLGIMLSNVVGGALVLAWLALADWAKPIIRNANTA